MPSIPVVIHHVNSCPEYLKKCVKLNSLKNEVYLIGDDTNNCFGSIAKHVHVNTLQSPDLPSFRKKFVNYSTNGEYREFLCFERFYILREFMRKHRFDTIAYVDSDCVLLENINRIVDVANITCAVSMQHVENKFHMVSCIHNSILTVAFCDAFIQLCEDIYVNKSRLHLVEGKINWHKTTGMGGGICDMTLCYIITEEGLVENVKDTNDIIMLDGEQCVFDHNISVSYGFSGENTFVQDPRRLKMITKKDGKYYAKTTTGSDVRLLSMHFSGGAKQVLTSLDENGFF